MCIAPELNVLVLKYFGGGKYLYLLCLADNSRKQKGIVWGNSLRRSVVVLT